MIIKEFKKYFTDELSGNYTSSESVELCTIFLEDITGFDRFHQRQFLNETLSESQLEYLNSVINKLKTGIPFQQILGETEFYGLKFFVNEHVLIPRPETEELLELAIEKIQDARFKIYDSEFEILDIGTGSGIIPIILKKHFPEAEITAIDLSEEALEMARKNADFHEVEIHFIQQDYLNNNLTEKYDVIISNPPYIGRQEESEIADSVKEFEPKMALFSPTSNALIFYEKIAKDCKNYLAEKGMVYLEINQKLGKETRDLFVDVLSDVELLKDLSGNERFVVGRKG